MSSLPQPQSDPPQPSPGGMSAAGDSTRDNHRARRDLLLVVLVTVSAFLVAAWLELNEIINAWTQSHEIWQVDELRTTLLVLATALGWFSWRRWRELRRELSLRLAVQADLARSLDENRELARRGLELQERERREVVQELHDELGQYLNAIQLEAVGLQNRLSSRQKEASASAGRVVELSRHVYDVARGLMRRLRPVALDDLGLEAALQHLLDGWQQRRPDVRCSLNVAAAVVDLPDEYNIAIYRIVQEALTNVARHAAASEVDITVESIGRSLIIKVKDNGRGLPEPVPHGLGLIGMRERAILLGGELHVETDRGVCVEMQIPMPPRQAKQHA